MRRREGIPLNYWLVMFAVVAIAFIWLGRMGCDAPRAHAYLGPCAPTDTLLWHYAVSDSGGDAANPTTVKAYFYFNGTLYDSVGMAASTIRYWIPRPGRVWGKVIASSGATTYGFGEVHYITTIQTMDVSTSDSWTVDSLHLADGNIGNVDGSVAAAKTLTTGERQAIADSVFEGRPTRLAAMNDSVWNNPTRTLTTSTTTITGADAKAIADSVILYRVGKALDSGVYDTTLGGRIYDMDVHASEGTWAAITQADCDTVKLAGVAIADAQIVVALSSDYSKPLYWTRTNGSGCFTVYVPVGATYEVRPVYQGTWLAAWCEVVK